MTAARSSFSDVYEEHVWRVYAFLSYRLRERDQAEDLTQATFERALRAWPRFDPSKASEATWLLTIARNLLIDRHRRSSHHREEPLTEGSHPHTEGPEARLSGSPELEVALEELSDREREVLALRFGADLTGPEIAALLELSLANVQQILSRTLRRLRDRLEGDQIVPDATRKPSASASNPTIR